jgi:hypothetical protein
MGIGADVAALREGRAVARVLDTDNDAELCAAGSVVVAAPLDALAEAFRDLSLLAAAGMVTASGRISETPSETDFRALRIPPADLAALVAARPGDSDVKLAEGEIEVVRRAGRDGVDPAFRRALLQRVLAWRASGFDGLGSYRDKRSAVDQKTVTRSLLERLGRTRPNGAFAQVESFEYWSVERFGGLKPFVALTNMKVGRRPGVVRIETVQLYASHYCDGLVSSVDLHELPDESGPRTLVRLTFRTQVDAFGGLLGGLKRRVGRSKMVEQLAAGLERLREQAPRVVIARV